MSQGLPLDEMKVVGAIFQESVNFCLDNATTDEEKNIHEFFLHLIMEVQPESMLTKQSVSDLQLKVFKNEHVRNFMMRLSYVFYSRWASSDEQITGLAQNLSRGFTQTPYIQGNQDAMSNSGVPDDIMKRMATRSEALARLSANPWLVLVCLVPLFMSKATYAAAAA